MGRVLQGVLCWVERLVGFCQRFWSGWLRDTKVVLLCFALRAAPVSGVVWNHGSWETGYF